MDWQEFWTAHFACGKTTVFYLWMMFFFKSYLWSDMRKKSKKYWNKRFGWQTLGFKAFWGLVLVDAQPSDYGCQNAFRTWIEWSNMEFPEFFQRSLLWMVAKSCTTKRKVETCCNPYKSVMMGCLPSIHWCRISSISSQLSGAFSESHAETQLGTWCHCQTGAPTGADGAPESGSAAVFVVLLWCFSNREPKNPAPCHYFHHYWNVAT